MTPQALSHFTFERYLKVPRSTSKYIEVPQSTQDLTLTSQNIRSGHQLVVVDIQGVGDLYTDPQIHTASAIEYGDGNLGTQVT